LEKVQKRATKILPALKNLPYSERLKTSNVSSYGQNAESAPVLILSLAADVAYLRESSTSKA